MPLLIMPYAGIDNAYNRDCPCQHLHYFLHQFIRNPSYFVDNKFMFGKQRWDD